MGTFGTRLKSLRESKKLTQVELASMIHVIRATLANWEIDRATPDADTLQRLADVFGVSTDYLLGRTSDPRPMGRTSGFGARLRQLRELRGLSIDKLSRQTGLDVAALETQNATPGSADMTKLAQALRVQLPHLTRSDGMGWFWNMPPEIQTMLLSEQSLPYLELIPEAMEKKVPPEVLRAAIEAAFQIIRGREKQSESSPPESR